MNCHEERSHHDEEWSGRVGGRIRAAFRDRPSLRGARGRSALRAIGLLAFLLVVQVLPDPALARSLGGGPPEGWELRGGPYLWMAGLEGDVAAISGLPAVDVDASFKDIIENTDFAFMFAAEVRRRQIGFLSDFVFLSLSANENTPGPLFGDADLESRTFFTTLAPFYRVVENDRLVVDVLAGVRVWNVDTRVRISPGVLAGGKAREEESWADPIFGARGSAVVYGPTSLSVAFDVGGFGASSDLTWQVLATLDLRALDWLLLRAGYRHVAVDFEDGGFEWDVELRGPILGGVVEW